MKVAFGLWNDSDEEQVGFDPGRPISEKIEYVVESLEACPQRDDLETTVQAAKKFLAKLHPNDVAVLFDPKRAFLRQDPMGVVAVLYRTKLQAMLASSRTAIEGVPDEVNETLTERRSATSRAKAHYPDAAAVVVGYVGALRAVLSDRALLHREQDFSDRPGGWDRHWTLAFLKSGASKRRRPYPRIALDFFEELGSPSNDSKACFRVRSRSSFQKTVACVAGVVGVALLILIAVALAVAFKKKKKTSGGLLQSAPAS